ncbi:MAG TPA: zinc ribbon domain-containing protein [Gemmatimonadaceae bacterium]|nr:zinc ribbon domain-containing protein [Gemmatimonadaceae bacterium]
MPTYEFRCPEGHEFEKFYRSISGAPRDVACPTCGKKAERQMSAGGGLVFKGSGFYITDYGKDGKKAQTPPAKAGEVAAAGSGGAEPGGAKGDSKAGADAKPSSEPKASTESKSHEPKPAAASKSAAKKAPGRAKSSE